jgi:hypothetical protein
MNDARAKEVLACYRPGIDDAAEPEVAEALALANTNPSLNSWWQNQQAVHQALRSKFRSLPVAEALKEQIISERPNPLARRFTRAVAFAALAAVILVTSFLMFRNQSLSTRETADFANFQSRMVRKIVREYPRMDLLTEDQNRIRQYLAGHDGIKSFTLPAPLANEAATTGCAIINWQGRKVSMICFNSGSKKNSTAADLFLFAVEREKITGKDIPAGPHHVVFTGVPVVTWTAGETVYLLAANGADELVRRYSGFGNLD